MKYLVVVPDGAGDEPVERLEGKTPLEVAEMPYINGLAAKGEVGMVRTVPPGIAPGSDAANLSVMSGCGRVLLTDILRCGPSRRLHGEASRPLQV